MLLIRRFDGGMVGAVAFAGLAFAAPSAEAQDSSQEIQALRAQVQDLLRRIDTLENQQAEREKQLEAAVADAVSKVEPSRVKPERKPPITIELSGRINQGLLYANNGDDGQFFIVDNDNSGSRLGLKGKGMVGETEIGAYLEASFEVNTTDEIDFDDNEPVGTNAGEDDFLSLRHAEWYAKNPTYGEAWVGFGDTATESVSEVDLSGTDCCFSQSDVDDVAGGLAFQSGDDVDAIFTNLDGERTSRIMYVTPEFAGFNGAVAVRQENGLRPDVSLAWGGEVFGSETEAAIGYRPTRDDDVESHTIHGSASTLLPSGLNFTAAAGIEFFPETDDEAQLFLFGKAGYRHEPLTIGETRWSLDFFYGESNTNGNFGGAGQVGAYSVGAGVVQEARDWATEFYLGGRTYWLDTPDGSDVDALFAVITGARVRF